MSIDKTVSVYYLSDTFCYCEKQAHMPVSQVGSVKKLPLRSYLKGTSGPSGNPVVKITQVNHIKILNYVYCSYAK